MTETRIPYRLLKRNKNRATLDTDIRTDLEELERRLIPLLMKVQQALGKEPSIQSNAKRRPAEHKEKLRTK